MNINQFNYNLFSIVSVSTSMFMSLFLLVICDWKMNPAICMVLTFNAALAIINNMVLQIVFSSIVKTGQKIKLRKLTNIVEDFNLTEFHMSEKLVVKDFLKKITKIKGIVIPDFYFVKLPTDKPDHSKFLILPKSTFNLKYDPTKKYLNDDGKMGKPFFKAPHYWKPNYANNDASIYLSKDNFKSYFGNDDFLRFK